MITFRKTKEAYGGLSNMAAGFPIIINDTYIKSSEALYQAFRYPDYPQIQQEILIQNSPMTAKMISKKYRPQTREDWSIKRVTLMRWCLRVKLIQNWETFGSLLLQTEDKIIVEESKKDKFWGAIPYEDDLVGINALGRLLMELRDEIPQYLNSNVLNPPNIDNFKLFGTDIGALYFNFNVSPKKNSDSKDNQQFQNENINLFDFEN